MGSGCRSHVSYSLNSLKRGYICGILYGTIIGVFRGDTRSSDYIAHVFVTKSIYTYVASTREFLL